MGNAENIGNELQQDVGPKTSPEDLQKEVDSMLNRKEAATSILRSKESVSQANDMWEELKNFVKFGDSGQAEQNVFSKYFQEFFIKFGQDGSDLFGNLLEEGIFGEEKLSRLNMSDIDSTTITILLLKKLESMGDKWIKKANDLFNSIGKDSIKAKQISILLKGVIGQDELAVGIKNEIQDERQKLFKKSKVSDESESIDVDEQIQSIDTEIQDVTGETDTTKQEAQETKQEAHETKQEAQETKQEAQETKQEAQETKQEAHETEQEAVLIDEKKLMRSKEISEKINNTAKLADSLIAKFIPDESELSINLALKQEQFLLKIGHNYEGTERENIAKVLALNSLVEENPELRKRISIDPDYVKFQQSFEVLPSDIILLSVQDKYLKNPAIAKFVGTDEKLTSLDIKDEKSKKLVSDQCLEFFGDELQNIITERDYGLSYEKFVKYYNDPSNIPEDKQASYEKIINKVLNPKIEEYKETLEVNFSQFLRLRSISVPKECFIKFFAKSGIGKEFDNEGEFDEGSLGIDMKESKRSVTQGFKYLGVQLFLKSINNDLFVSNPMNKNGGVYNHGYSKINDLFSGIDPKDIMNCIPNLDFGDLISGAKSKEEVSAKLITIVNEKVDDLIAKKVEENAAGGDEIEYELHRRVVADRILNIGQPKPEGYTFGSTKTIDKVGDDQLYPLIEAFDKGTASMTAGEMQILISVLDDPKMQGFIEKSGQSITGVNGKTISTITLLTQMNIIDNSTETKIDLNRLQKLANGLRNDNAELARREICDLIGCEDLTDLKFELVKDNNGYFMRENNPASTGVVSAIRKVGNRFLGRNV